MLLIFPDPGIEAQLTADESRVLRGATEAWLADTDRRGVRLEGGRLQPPSAATTIRVRDEQMTATEEPFGQTKEQLVGYSIVECADLDQAIKVAAEHPVARIGAIEVRPLST